jgi:hypothetical protein
VRVGTKEAAELAVKHIERWCDSSKIIPDEIAALQKVPRLCASPLLHLCAYG